MKKLVISIIAAAALFLGFASCSGDLHDDVAPEELYIIGALKSSTWDKTEKMTKKSTGVFEIETALAANAQFKFILVADKGDDSWSAAQSQYGSDGFSTNGQAKNFEANNDKEGMYTVNYNAMTGAISIVPVVSKIVITIPESTGYKTSTLTITGIGSDGTSVDGSLFSWAGGSVVTLSGAGPVYEITANCTGGYPEWCAKQNLFQNKKEGDGAGLGLPVGTDCTAKFKIGGAEGWVCFTQGGSYTFDWANLKK